MPPVNILNLWGRGASVPGQPFAGGYDAQRTDLWQLDLRGVASHISASFINAKWGIYADNLPDPSVAAYYARSIELPELSVDAQPVVRDTLPYSMPAADKPAGLVSMTFLIDVPVPQTSFGSKFVALLYAWRALVRAGRGAFDGGFDTNMSYEVALGLQDAADNGSLQPNYRFDVPLNLLRGDTPVTNSGVFQGYYVGGAIDNAAAVGQLGASNIGLSVAGVAPIGLQYSTTYTIRQMWLASFKPGSFKYSEGGVAEIPATFYCSDVVQTTPPP